MTINFSQIRKRHKTQGGQAIAELGVCIVAIVIVLLGFFLIFILSSENVKMAIQSREQADEDVRNRSQNNGNAQSIHHWDYGTRGIPFTTDDQPVTDNIGGGTFLDQLTANDNYGDDNNSKTIDYGVGGKDNNPISMNLITDGGQGKNYLPDDYNPMHTISLVKLFLDAANLTGGKKQETDPLGKRNMSNLQQNFEKMFNVQNLSIEDTTYMPVPPSVRLPENME